MVDYYLLDKAMALITPIATTMNTSTPDREKLQEAMSLIRRATQMPKTNILQHEFNRGFNKAKNKQ